MFEINTTSIARDFTYTDTDGAEQTQTINAGIRIAIDGLLDISGLLTLAGNFELNLTAESTTLSIAATAVILDTTFTFTGLAAIYTDANLGIVGVLSVSVSELSIGDFATLSGTYLFELNTTGVDRDFEYAHPIEGVQIRTIDAGLRLSIGGTLDISGLVTLAGNFELNIKDNSLTITVSAAADMLDTTINCTGVLGIYADDNPGIAGTLYFPNSFELIYADVKFSGIFLFEVNTTGVDRDFTYTDPIDGEQTRTIKAGTRIFIRGAMELPDQFTLYGSFSLIITNDSLTITVVATVIILESELTVTGVIGVYADENIGIVGALDVSGSIAFLQDNGVNLTGNFRLGNQHNRH